MNSIKTAKWTKLFLIWTKKNLNLFEFLFILGLVCCYMGNSQNILRPCAKLKSIFKIFFSFFSERLGFIKLLSSKATSPYCTTQRFIRLWRTRMFHNYSKLADDIGLSLTGQSSSSSQSQSSLPFATYKKKLSFCIPVKRVY